MAGSAVMPMERRPKLEAETVIVAIGSQLVRLGDKVCAVGGILCFDVTGVGRWSVSLDTPGGVWEKGCESADTTVTLPKQQFEDLVLNPDALDAAFDAGLIKVTGDTEKWNQLGQLLATLGEPRKTYVMESPELGMLAFRAIGDDAASAFVHEWDSTRGIKSSFRLATPPEEAVRLKLSIAACENARARNETLDQNSVVAALTLPPGFEGGTGGTL